MRTRRRPRPPAAPGRAPDRDTPWDHFFNALTVALLLAFAVGVVLVPALRAWLFVMVVGTVLLWLYCAVPTMLSTRPEDTRWGG